MRRSSIPQTPKRSPRPPRLRPGKPSERLRIAAPVHPAWFAAAIAAPGPRGRREGHRVHRPVLRDRPYYLLGQTLLVLLWIAAQRGRDRLLRLRPVPVHPAQPRLLDPGRLRRAADPAGPDPAGKPRPGRPRRGSASRRPDEGQHRVPGPRVGRATACPQGVPTRDHLHDAAGHLRALLADLSPENPGPEPRTAAENSG